MPNKLHQYLQHLDEDRDQDTGFQGLVDSHSEQ